MTERNFKKELSHSVYYDMEDGNDTETICYPSLIHIITELCDRIEQLETQLKDVQEIIIAQEYARNIGL
jgi:hypothetical protein